MITWAGRVTIFIRERFPVVPNLLVVFVGFSILYLFLSSVHGNHSVNWPELTWGAWGAGILTLLIRISDDLKDFVADKDLFPERPLARGAVHVNDIKFLALILIAIITGLGLWVFPSTVLPALVTFFFYLFFFHNWFFLKQHLQKKLSLALLTHNPIVLVLHYYLLSFFSPLNQTSIFMIMFLVGDAATGTAWEIARKIRPSKTETHYTTYSKIWGLRKSIAITCTIATSAFILTLIGAKGMFSTVSQPLNPLYSWALPGTALLYLIFNGINYIKSQNQDLKILSHIEVFRVSLLAAYLITFISS